MTTRVESSRTAAPWFASTVPRVYVSSPQKSSSLWTYPKRQNNTVCVCVCVCVVYAVLFAPFHWWYLTLSLSTHISLWTRKIAPCLASPAYSLSLTFFISIYRLIGPFLTLYNPIYTIIPCSHPSSSHSSRSCWLQPTLPWFHPNHR